MRGTKVSFRRGLGAPRNAMFSSSDGRVRLARRLRNPDGGVLDMPAALLVLFPLLLMFNSRLAFAALAIGLLPINRRKPALRPVRLPVDDSRL
jgi:hypothetical protein